MTWPASIARLVGRPRRVRPAPMPFLVGSPRSGTTLLRFMLDAHPEVAIPPETGFQRLIPALEGTGDALRERLFEAVTTFPESAPAWDDFGIPAAAFRERLARLEPFTRAEGVRTFYRMYAERFGKPRWGDKTPLHCRQMPALEALLPEARFVHVVRDGRDASLSLRRTWFSPGSDIETLARFWRENVESARRDGALVRHFLEVRYEAVIADPERELRRICDFLELAWNPAMLRYPERTPDRLAEHRERRLADGGLLVSREERLRQQALTLREPLASRVGVWRGEMSDDEIAGFAEVAGDLLAIYGYPVGRSGATPATPSPAIDRPVQPR